MTGVMARVAGLSPTLRSGYASRFESLLAQSFDGPPRGCYGR